MRKNSLLGNTALCSLGALRPLRSTWHAELTFTLIERNNLRWLWVMFCLRKNWINILTFTVPLFRITKEVCFKLMRICPKYSLHRWQSTQRLTITVLISYILDFKLDKEIHCVLNYKHWFHQVENVRRLSC